MGCFDQLTSRLEALEDRVSKLEKRRSSRMEKPTLEMIAYYCKERNNSVDPQQWIDHYTSNGWMVGKTPMKDWKAAVRKWEKSNGTNGQRGASPVRESFFERDQRQKREARAAERALMGLSGGGAGTHTDAHERKTFSSGTNTIQGEFSEVSEGEAN